MFSGDLFRPSLPRGEAMIAAVSLRIKSMLVASPLEAVAKNIQWWIGLSQRRRHPELWEIYQEDRLLPHVLKRLLSANSNVLDVGAHIGSFLSLASALAKDGNHAAIEASPNKSALLSMKFPRAKIKNVAISDYIGTAIFEDNLQNSGFSKLQGGHHVEGKTRRYEVNVATLDSLCLGKFDLMKIDIEGNELNALKGGEGFISQNRPAILFECGPVYVEGLDRFALFDYLTQKLLYDVFLFQDFLHDKGPLSRDEFRKCGIYPFRAFNFVALPCE
jgi:FkbM family methyltransferase